MPTISQILSVSYPAVINQKNKAANQFAESAALREMERQRMLQRKSLGPTIEHTLDYKRNPSTQFLTTDLQTTSLTKTEVLTAAVYTPASISADLTWSKADEAKNPSVNQKIALVSSLIDNVLESHDDILEEALFQANTDGFLGLPGLLPDDGEGAPGGIDASIDIWWRNFVGEYYTGGTDMQAALTAAWNAAAKGTGGSAPTMILSDSDAQAIYESTLQAQQRFLDTTEADGGFKVIAFKTSRWVFSQYGDGRIYMTSPKHFHLNVSKEAYRELGETIEIPTAQGFVRKIFSMLQFSTSNKSRGAVLLPTTTPPPA